jgi:23S rRNA (pseudouridine1915-N3)-methyltransferase
MNIEVFYHDKFRFIFEEELFNVYKKRINDIPKNIISKFSYKRVSKKDIEKTLKNKKSNSFIILLDEDGKSYSSKKFTDLIFSISNKNILFIIGGTDGFTDTELKMSKSVLSLSKMTLTHSFSLIILLEQIYRSATIKLNHPYHRK